MCDAAVREDPCQLHYVPDHFKSQEMCIKAVMEDPCALEFVPDHFKTQEMCDKAVRDDPSYLACVPDWFVRQQQVNMWYDDYYNDYDYDEIIKCYNGYKKRKAQKVQIKEALLPTA